MTTILVIEDDDDIRELYKRILGPKGYEIIEAPNGWAGLNLFRERPADIVITDIIMPEKEGLETIRELRRDFPDVKIIAISGGGEAIGSSTCLSLAKLLGAKLTLPKPINAAMLLEAVRELSAGSEGCVGQCGHGS